jgi:ubiquitin C-terminal hydrolase
VARLEAEAAAFVVPAGIWACGVCTTRNALAVTHCGTCGTGRAHYAPFAPVGAPAGWRRQLSRRELATRLASFTTPCTHAAAPGSVPGLPNLGNTCFMAAGVQALLSAAPLRAALEPDALLAGGVRQTHSLGYAGDLALAFSALVRARKSGHATASLAHVRRVLGRVGDLGAEFASGAQHDAAFLMRHALDGLSEDTCYAGGEGEGRNWHAPPGVRFNTPRLVTPRSPVRDLTGNTLVTRHYCALSCGACRAENRLFETGVVVPLPRSAAGSTPLHVTLQDCLTHKNREHVGQPLGNCTAKRMRREFYEHPPQVLVLSLERFDSYGNRIDTVVRVPLEVELDGAHGFLHPAAYALSAVTLHIGASRRGGHYVAAVRAPDGKGWLMCDDNHVSQVRDDFTGGLNSGARGDVTAVVLVRKDSPPPPPPRPPIGGGGGGGGGSSGGGGGGARRGCIKEWCKKQDVHSHCSNCETTPGREDRVCASCGTPVVAP